jgi:hypothetical protein
MDPLRQGYHAAVMHLYSYASGQNIATLLYHLAPLGLTTTTTTPAVLGPPLGFYPLLTLKQVKG